MLQLRKRRSPKEPQLTLGAFLLRMSEYGINECVSFLREKRPTNVLPPVVFNGAMMEEPRGMPPFTVKQMIASQCLNQETPAFVGAIGTYLLAQYGIAPMF